MGGAFGLRSHVFAEIAMTLWAAKKLRRPVKWRGDRSEGLMEDHGRDVVLDAQLGLDADGKFTALKVEGIANMGAYLSNFGPLPAFGNLSGIAGPYTTPAIAAKVTSVFTNTAAVHPYRGAGSAGGDVVDRAGDRQGGAELDIDRVELRRRNLIAPDAMPYQTPLSYCYDCGEFERNMDAALERCDYAGFAARREASEANGKLRVSALLTRLSKRPVCSMKAPIFGSMPPGWLRCRSVCTRTAKDTRRSSGRWSRANLVSIQPEFVTCTEIPTWCRTATAQVVLAPPGSRALPGWCVREDR